MIRDLYRIPILFCFVRVLLYNVSHALSNHECRKEAPAQHRAAVHVLASISAFQITYLEEKKHMKHKILYTLMAGLLLASILLSACTPQAG